MAGESILQYNKKAPTGTTSGQPANNFNRNHAATSKPMNGWKGQIFGYTNNNYSFAGMPTTFDSTLSSIGSGNSTSALDTITTIFTAATSFAGLAMTGIQIANAIKSTKKDNNSNSVNENSTELGSLTQQASNCKKKDREDVSTKLGNAIADAQSQSNTAKCKKTSAEKTYNSNKTKYDEKVEEHDKFKSEKLALEEDVSKKESNIRTLNGELAAKKSQLSSMTRTEENAAEYDKLKAEVENLEEAIEASKKELKAVKDRLKEDYSSSKEDNITDLMAHYKSQMDAAQNEIKEADEKIKKLDKEIKEAQAAKKQLDAKIAQDNN